MIKQLLISTLPIFLIVTPVWGETAPPLSMEECIETGLKNNLDIKKSNYDILTAKEKTKQILSQYEPLLAFSTGRTDIKNPVTSSIYGSRNKTDSASLSINKKTAISGGTLGIIWKNEKTDTDASSASFNPSYNSDVALSYSQPLINNFAGKNDRKNIRISKLQEGIVRLSYEAERNMLINKIKKGYLDLNLAKLNLKIEKSFLNRSRQLLSLNKKKFADGLVEEVDIIASEAEVTLSMAAIMRTEDEVNNARERLLNTMGVNENKEYFFAELDLTQLDRIAMDEKEIISIANANRPELRLIKNMLEIDSLTKEIKANEKRPSLSLDTSYGFSGSNDTMSDSYSALSEGTYPSWYIGLSLTLYPYNKKQASRIKEADYAYSKNLTEYKKIKLLIITDARIVTRHIKTQLLYIEATQNVVNLQNKKFRLENEKFNQGRSSTKWILAYQNDLSKAEIGNLRALTDYHKAKADLEFITGVTK